MDYCIKNHKNVYIKLNGNGQPVTCGESLKGLFAEHKAKNILNSLPKTLRKMNFRIVAIPDIKPKEIKEDDVKRKEYELSDEISDWVNKFGVCADIFNEAKQRKIVLVDELHKKDNELIDILHIIEIEKPKDMFGGWKLYKSIWNNRKERRKIKDELLVVGQVLEEINPASIQRDRLQKVIDGLFTRKYTFRVVEERSDENENL